MWLKILKCDEQTDEQTDGRTGRCEVLNCYLDFTWLTFLAFSNIYNFHRASICCLHSFFSDPISRHIFSCITSRHRPHCAFFVNCWRKWKICKWGRRRVHFSDNFAFFLFLIPPLLPYWMPLCLAPHKTHSIENFSIWNGFIYNLAKNLWYS